MDKPIKVEYVVSPLLKYALQYTGDNIESFSEMLSSEYEVHKLLNGKLVIIDTEDCPNLADVLYVGDYYIVEVEEDATIGYCTVCKKEDFTNDFIVIT